MRRSLVALLAVLPATLLAVLPATLLAVLPATLLAAASNSWSLQSPDGLCEITVGLSEQGELSYQVSRAGKPVLLRSPLGLWRADGAFDRGLKLEDAGKVERRRETYELFAGTRPRVDQVLNNRSLVFRDTNGVRLALDLAASDEGVAFRYRFPGETSDVRIVTSERTGFRFTPGVRGWLQPYHGASDYTPAHEDFYFQVSPGDPPPRSRGNPVGWCFPALFSVPAATTWVLLTESGTDGSYCGCHLDPDSAGGLYRIAFPLEQEGTKGHANQFGPEPRHVLPWTLPWRVILLGTSAGDIAMSTLVTDLAPASRIADTSWIKPGRASWGWWSHPDGPTTAGMFNAFSEFAGRMGWEFTLFDAGWWKPGLSGIANHARSNGVSPLAWCFAGDFYTPAKRKRKCDELQAAGVCGLKVDFWCSDRQEAIAAMHALFEEAAARHLVVNLHGCTLPRGWQRTWPNFLTAEAVLGAESYFYESKYPEKAAELNTVLPFTRNAVGPMDYTPVAGSPKKYLRSTTAAHELATAIIFTSGLIHYADGPEFFDSLPAEARQVLHDAPARWDETRCLVGEPGRVAVFARRAAGTWFIAGINGTAASLPVVLDLSPFRDFRRRLLIAEDRESQMQVGVYRVKDAEEWKHAFPPRGGFILRLDE